MPVSQVSQPPAAKAAAPAVVARPAVPESPNIVQRIGAVIICLHVIAFLLNEVATRYLGTKAYVSMVTLVLSPVVCVITGRIFRGLQHRMGVLWLIFLVWLTLAIPSSIWPWGSVELWENYVSRSYLMFFYICAVTVTVTQCRRLMLTNVIGGILLLFVSAKSGELIDGRLMLTNSPYFDNPNDLGLNLVFFSSSFLFLVFNRKFVFKLAGVGLIFGAMILTMQTGSRGSFVAVLSCAIAVICISGRRLQVIVLGLPVLLAAMLLTPARQWQRLTFVVADTSEALIQTEDELSSLESQMERMELLKLSLQYTVLHPLFGVGPGQFPEMVDSEARKRQRHMPWLNTHNSYTQVSSECGIPALVLYVMTIAVVLKTNFRLYKQAKDLPGLEQHAALAFCSFIGTVGFAVSSFFHNVAYTWYLPWLAGMTFCTMRAMQAALPETSSAPGGPVFRAG